MNIHAKLAQYWTKNKNVRVLNTMIIQLLSMLVAGGLGSREDWGLWLRETSQSSWHGTLSSDSDKNISHLHC